MVKRKREEKKREEEEEETIEEPKNKIKKRTEDQHVHTTKDNKKITEAVQYLDQTATNKGGRPWKQKRERTSTINKSKYRPEGETGFDRYQKQLAEKKEKKRMKNAEKAIKDELEEERKEAGRRMRQRRRYKQEQAWKAKKFEALKQSTKSTGKNQKLTNRQWKEVKARAFL